MLSVGTRGDVEPFLVVAELLREAGHEVHCAFPEQYVALASDRNFPFTPFDRRFLELVEGEAGRAFLGGRISGWKRARALWHLFREGLRINQVLAAEQEALLTNGGFDRVIFHPKATFVYAWAVQNPGRVVLLSPVPWAIHPAAGQPHLGFGWMGRLGLGKLSYRLANFGLRQNVLSPTRAYRKQHGITAADIRRAITGTPLFYNVSPALLPPEPDWPDHVRVLGYLRHPSEESRPVPENVAGFMDRHPDFIVVTFGSMTNPDPAGNTQIVLDALTAAGLPAILNVAAGGLQEPDAYDRDRFLFTATLVYDRVFARAAAVVHHGGAGTTQTGLTYGCPTLLIPHIVDQFAWATLVRDRGLGPTALPISTLKQGELTESLRALTTNPTYCENARRLGERMRAENHRKELLRFLLAS